MIIVLSVLPLPSIEYIIMIVIVIIFIWTKINHCSPPVQSSFTNPKIVCQKIEQMLKIECQDYSIWHL